MLLILPIAFSIALILDVSWKWRFILVPVVIATIIVPWKFVDPASSAFTLIRLGAVAIQILMSVAFFIRLKLPYSML